MYVGSAYWSQLNSNVYVVALPATTSPAAKIRTNFNSAIDTTGNAATGVSFNGLRNLKIASGNPNNMICVLNSASTDNMIWYSLNGGIDFNTPTAGNTSFGLGANISHDGKVMGVLRTSNPSSYFYSSDSGTTWNSIGPSFILARGLSYNNDGSKGFFVSGSVATGALITNVSSITNKTIPWVASDSYMQRNGNKIWIAKYTDAANTIAAYSTNNGDSWTSVTIEAGSGVQSSAPAIDGSDDGQHLCFTPGTTQNHIYVSNNGGSTWNKKTIGATSYVFAMCVSRSGRYMVIASNTVNGKYFYSTDYGQNWTSTTISGVSATFGALAVQEF